MMNLLEQELAKNERRIKRIVHNPDPTKLESNRLFFECQLDLRRSQLKAWKEKTPIAYYVGGGVESLLRALGCEIIDKELIVNRLIAYPDLLAKTKQLLEAQGYTEFICDRSLYPIGLAMQGELPPPTFILYSNGTCLPSGQANLTLGHLFNVPIYTIDIPFETPNKGTIAYVAKQFADFVLWAEKEVPGVQFDETKFTETYEADLRYMKYLNQMYKMKRNIPCPLSARDALREESPPSYYPDSGKALAWAKQMYDELHDRLKTGIGLPPREKLRVAWISSGAPIHDPTLFDLFEERDVTIPVMIHGFTSRLCLLRPSGKNQDEGGMTSFEKLAQFYRFTWSGLAEEWIEDALFLAKDQNVDAVVCFWPRGCIPILGIGKLLTERIEKDLGIPIFEFEGGLIDSAGYDPARVHERLGDFLDLCIDQKGRD